MGKDFKKMILDKVKKSGKVPLGYKKLLRSCKVSDKEFKRFTDTLERLKNKGVIYEGKKGIILAKYAGLVTAKIMRLNKTFAFAKNEKNDEEIFIPGKYLKGSMPGDIVALKTQKSKNKGESLEGEVVSIIDTDFKNFTGNISFQYGDFCVVPDMLYQYALPIENVGEVDIREGDKVVCELAYRGNRHSDHTCRVISNFGSSEKASVCALSVLSVNGVSEKFSDEVVKEAKKVTDYSQIEKEAKNRKDLRDDVIFTIDGADTKDIDDAISIKKKEFYYELGVHIADVSFYVKPKSKLDNEALNRGTSVYYANRVVPMLPKELSNGICSLNPDEDRLAFSAIVKIDFEGNIIKYKFKKTIIRSRIKGVYSEINQILAGTESKEIAEKYKDVKDNLLLMEELAQILNENKLKRGAPQLETSESKLIINKDDFCVDVIPRTRGRSEEIIEDFMLIANQCAANLAKEKSLPFVYRVHEDPAIDKTEKLEETLKKLNIFFPPHKKIKPKHLAEIIENSKGSSLQMVINNLVLRSMAKAKYSSEPIGHFGLVLEDYAHFTSPIRRYPDLSIHRILTDYVAKIPTGEISKKYNKFVFHSSEQSTKQELVAMKVERECEDCYKAEYMNSHLGEEFDGVIVSVLEFGFFVELKNTCEGYVAIEELPEGEYNFDGSMKLTSATGNDSYCVGDKVKIKVAKANVSSGKIDFSLV